VSRPLMLFLSYRDFLFLNFFVVFFSRLGLGDRDRDARDTYGLSTEVYRSPRLYSSEGGLEYSLRRSGDGDLEIFLA
jgi:hypothetical protein